MVARTFFERYKEGTLFRDAGRFFHSAWLGINRHQAPALPDELNKINPVNRDQSEVYALAEKANMRMNKDNEHELLPTLQNTIEQKIKSGEKNIDTERESLKKVRGYRLAVEMESRIQASQKRINEILTTAGIATIDFKKNTSWEDIKNSVSGHPQALHEAEYYKMDCHALQEIKAIRQLETTPEMSRKSANALMEVNNFLARFVTPGQDLENGEKKYGLSSPFEQDSVTHPKEWRGELEKQIDEINAFIPELKRCQAHFTLDPNSKVYLEKYHELRDELRKKLFDLKIASDNFNLRQYPLHAVYFHQLTALCDTNNTEYRFGHVPPALEYFEHEVNVTEKKVPWIYEYDANYGWFGGMRKVAKPEFQAPAFIWQKVLGEPKFAGNFDIIPLNNGQTRYFFKGKEGPKLRNEFLQRLREVSNLKQPNGKILSPIKDAPLENSDASMSIRPGR